MDPATCYHVDCPLREVCLEIGTITILPASCLACIDRQAGAFEQEIEDTHRDLASVAAGIAAVQAGIDACHRDARDLLARAERNFERSNAIMASLDAIDGKIAKTGFPVTQEMTEEMASTRMAARSALADLASSIEVARKSMVA